MVQENEDHFMKLIGFSKKDKSMTYFPASPKPRCMHIHINNKSINDFTVYVVMRYTLINKEKNEIMNYVQNKMKLLGISDYAVRIYCHGWPHDFEFIEIGSKNSWFKMNSTCETLFYKKEKLISSLRLDCTTRMNDIMIISESEFINNGDIDSISELCALNGMHVYLYNYFYEYGNDAYNEHYRIKNMNKEFSASS